MPKSYIFEGNTTSAAVDKGLKELKVKKDDVEIKVLDTGKKSFFSILEPRIVKVEMTLKDNAGSKPKDNDRNSSRGNSSSNSRVKDREMNRATEAPKREKQQVDPKDVKKQLELIETFLKEFISKLPEENIKYTIEHKDDFIYVDLTGENIKYLIGYRGETLNALQNIMKAISRRNVAFGAKVILNVEGYRKQREAVLRELADKVSKTVVRTRKSIMLEPMSSFERKIIHEQLQNNDKIKTYSTGNEPHRKIVIDLK